MKKHILILLSVLSCNLLHAQLSWTQKANYPSTALVGSRTYCRSVNTFVVNDKAYLIGNGYTWSKTGTVFYAFDPALNSWTATDSIPTKFTRTNATGFVINDIIYYGLGFTGSTTSSTSIASNDFYSFDPSSNTWATKSGLPGMARYSSIGFSIGGKGYIMLGDTGYTQAGTVKSVKEVWEYDPAADQWTQKSDFPGAPRSGAIVFVINNKAYVGLGNNSTVSPSIYLKDMWEYNAETDTWTQKSDCVAGTRTTSGYCNDAHNGYILGGLSSTGVWENGVWKYNPAIDAWANVGTLPSGENRLRLTASVIKSKIYVGTGGKESDKSSLNDNNEFWESGNLTTGVNNIYSSEENIHSLIRDNFLQLNNVTPEMTLTVIDIHGKTILNKFRLSDNNERINLANISNEILFIFISDASNQIIHRNKLIKIENE